MPEFICITCGTQFAASDRPPDRCAICDEERQYVNPRGQTWTTLPDLRRDHRNALTVEEPQLTGIRTDPSFAIGQRALLVQTTAGNVALGLREPARRRTERAVRALGGVRRSPSPIPTTILRWWNGARRLMERRCTSMLRTQRG